MREINPRHAVPEGDMTKRNPVLKELVADSVLDPLGKLEIELAYLLARRRPEHRRAPFEPPVRRGREAAKPRAENARSPMEIEGKRIAALVGDGFEESELMEPRRALEEAGAVVTIVGVDDRALQKIRGKTRLGRRPEREGRRAGRRRDGRRLRRAC